MPSPQQEPDYRTRLDSMAGNATLAERPRAPRNAVAQWDSGATRVDLPVILPFILRGLTLEECRGFG